MDQWIPCFIVFTLAFKEENKDINRREVTKEIMQIIINSMNFEDSFIRKIVSIIFGGRDR